MTPAELRDLAADCEMRLTKDWRQYPGNLRRLCAAARALAELKEGANAKPAPASVQYGMDLQP